MIYRIIDEESDVIFVDSALMDYLPKKTSQRIDITTRNFVFYLEPKLKATATKIFQSASRKHKEDFVRSIEENSGIDVVPLMQREDLSPLIYKKVADNVNLIKSIPEKYAEKTKDILAESLTKKDWTGAVDKLEELGNVTRRRAKLIVRDQMEKVNAALNEERQKGIGVTHYIWRTVGDSRVRSEHRDRDGERFAWNDPPDDGHPGEPVNCRCVADPDLSTVEF